MIPTGRNPAVVAGAEGDVWVSLFDGVPGLADPRRVDATHPGHGGGRCKHRRVAG